MEVAAILVGKRSTKHRRTLALRPEWKYVDLLDLINIYQLLIFPWLILTFMEVKDKIISDFLSYPLNIVDLFVRCLCL